MTNSEIGIRENVPIEKLVQTIDSKRLLNGQKELVIVHRGEEYRLHLTKSGKLLLTK